MTRAAGLLLALATTGCVTVGTQTLPAYQEWRLPDPVPPDSVNVFLSGDTVPEHCHRIAILSARGNDAWTDESQMLGRLREEAGKLGGNAISMPKTEEPSSGEKIAGALFGTGSSRKVEAVLVYVCVEGGRRLRPAPSGRRISGDHHS